MELTEKEAEEALKEMQVLGQGISTQAQVKEWIETTVTQAHGALD